MSVILTATILVGSVGLFVGLFLGIAGIKFKVDTDEREEKILEVLPGANCGGCGYPGCAAMAEAITKGKAPVNGCPVGGEPVANKVASIMGVENVQSIHRHAFVKCIGDCDKALSNYEYTGIEDCKALAFVPAGGPKSCSYGCLGFGSCVKVCQFDAIHVINGIAQVDKEKCKACGKCVEACPRKLIEMVPYDSDVKVACNSKDKGPMVMKACTVGCIGCGLCAKNCPMEAIKVEDNLASIDYEKCSQCRTCVEKCPRKVIIDK